MDPGPSATGKVSLTATHPHLGSQVVTSTLQPALAESA